MYHPLAIMIAFGNSEKDLQENSFQRANDVIQSASNSKTTETFPGDD
jgi:hypothetical protein